MDRGADDRGVSEVVGFVLLFGILVVAFTVYQGVVVPDQNRQVEFEHNRAVKGQMQDLRNAIVSTAATGSGQAVSVTLGATYPRRAIARNLGVSAGTIETIELESDGIRIDDVRALDVETQDYVGSDHAIGPVETKSIRYRPVYSFYSGAPTTIYENTLVYNRFAGANLTVTDQIVIDGRRITLIAINGSLSKAQQGTVSINTAAISASSTRIAVTNTTGERINVTIPTRLDAAKWEEILADEMVGNGGHVDGVYDVPGESAVNVTLEGGVTYELRMAKVGVGHGTTGEPPMYVTVVEGNGTSVPEGGTQKLVVEVRDRFNNPVSGVTVSATLSREANLSDDLEAILPSSDTTDSNGRATFTYAAPGIVDGAKEATIEVTFEDGDLPTETATFVVTVLDSDGSG